MSNLGNTWRCLAMLALLACSGLGDFAGAPPEHRDAHKPLPAEIIKAWRDSGSDVGWMKDAPPKACGWGFWVPWREKAEAGAIPAFLPSDRKARAAVAKLPDPGTPFGLNY